VVERGGDLKGYGFEEFYNLHAYSSFEAKSGFDGRVTLGLKAWDRTAYWVGGVLVVVYAM
jgi:hypothetical protein